MTEKLTIAKALNRGLRRALQADPKVLLAGEDIGKLGGVFRITEGLQAEFGENRVIDSPLAESGIIGTAVGLCMRGYRPVVEIQFDGFVFPGFAQIVTQVAKFHMRTGGQTPMPMVIRIPFGGGIGAVEHHSESPEAYFAHTPGLKVVSCANPTDAYWMIQQAIQSDDPVVFLEPKRRYQTKDEVDFTQKPAPMHQAAITRYGTDATLLCYGPMVKTCLEAAAVAGRFERIRCPESSDDPHDHHHGNHKTTGDERRRDRATTVPGHTQLARHVRWHVQTHDAPPRELPNCRRGSIAR